MSPAVPVLLASVALLALPGCATREPDRLDLRGIQVVVVNDLTPPTALTARVIGSSVSFRRLLGNVPPGSTRAFSFRPPAPNGDYRLIGESPTGETVESRVFQSSTGDAVHWSVRRNTVDVRRVLDEF